MVAIQGKLEEAGLPDVLQLLALGKKTGLLSLSDQAVEGHIYLDGEPLARVDWSGTCGVSTARAGLRHDRTR